MPIKFNKQLKTAPRRSNKIDSSHNSNRLSFVYSYKVYLIIQKIANWQCDLDFLNFLLKVGNVSYYATVIKLNFYLHFVIILRVCYRRNIAVFYALLIHNNMEMFFRRWRDLNNPCPCSNHKANASSNFSLKILTPFNVICVTSARILRYVRPSCYCLHKIILWFVFLYV